VDAQIETDYALASKKFDIEFQLLIEAVYHLYHYDFRDYAQASLRRRLRTAMLRFQCETLSQLQDRVMREPQMFHALLDHLTVQVSEMFRDPSYFRAQFCCARRACYRGP
jgi:chemotaxis protein methyltransferase CheR